MSKILVIDDEREFTDMLSFRLVKTGGYEVIEAFDGEEGLALAKEKLPDLILLDIMMPKMDGIQVIKHLKEEDKTRHIPIIVITASVNPKTTGKFKEIGAFGFLVKPLDPEMLTKKIKEALEHKNA